MAGYSSYCAAKAGVINFASVLRRELLYKNIRVYVACPADIETPQFEYECKQMPDWMCSKEGKHRPKAMSAEIAAKKILKKCSGNGFMIIINAEIYFLIVLSKMLPQQWIDFILDKMFPQPIA